MVNHETWRTTSSVIGVAEAVNKIDTSGSVRHALPDVSACHPHSITFSRPHDVNPWKKSYASMSDTAP